MVGKRYSGVLASAAEKRLEEEKELECRHHQACAFDQVGALCTIKTTLFPKDIPTTRHHGKRGRIAGSDRGGLDRMKIKMEEEGCRQSRQLY